jgi:uncharacterized protein
MRRIAIIGSGVAGLAAARRLSSDPGVRVELFEAAPRAGGHTNTILVGDVPVDTGFIIYNERTYPRFTRLLAELGVETRATDMSFSVSCERCGVEWGSAGLRSVFAQRRNAARARHWLMLAEILRFFSLARRSLATVPDTLSLGDFLSGARIAPDAVRHFVIPMGAAIWSTSAGRMREFPAVTYLRFFANHGMLALFGGPRWRTIVGGSRVYVDRLLARLPAARVAVHLSAPIVRVDRDGRGVQVQLSDGRELGFDSVVLATHSDTALALLADPTADERRVLGAIPYTRNDTWLHTDERFLPRARDAWSSWNYRIADCSADEGALHATYWMNRLQGLPGPTNYLVTLNPATAPAGAVRRIDYAHPLYTLAALRAQRELPRLQGVRRTWFAGAYHHYGFHEDGLRSGEEAAAAVVAATPGQPRGSRARESEPPAASR